MLHSLVPAYAQSKMDGRYGLLQLGGLAGHGQPMEMCPEI